MPLNFTPFYNSRQRDLTNFEGNAGKKTVKAISPAWGRQSSSVEAHRGYRYPVADKILRYVFLQHTACTLRQIWLIFSLRL